MRRLICLCAMLLAWPALAATYYVDATEGLDTNAGTTTTAPWQTLAKVTATVTNGDTVYLQRGETWRETLSVDTGVTYDAYGTGEPPTIDGRDELNDATDWSADGTVDGVWRATITGGTTLELDGMGGDLEANAAACTEPMDYYISGTTLYVYSGSRPPNDVWDDIQIWARTNAVTGTGNNWTLNHLRLRGYRYGVRLNGTGVKIQYCEIERGDPDRTRTPIGILSDSGASSAAVTNVTCANAGTRCISTATGTITAKNVVAVGSFDEAFYASGSGSIAYDHCMLLGNAILNDLYDPQVVSGTDGGSNVEADLTDFAAFPDPPLAAISSDDGEDGAYATWIADVVSEFGTRTCPGLAVCPLSVGYKCGRATSGVATYAAYEAAGQVDSLSHSWGHLYAVLDFDGTGTDPGLNIRYVGAGTAATMTIVNSGVTWTLETTVDGTSDLSYDLRAAANDTATELCALIDADADYTCAVVASSVGGTQTAVHTTNLAAVTGQDIKTATYKAVYAQERSERDELRSAREWLQANITGYTKPIWHVWPGGGDATQNAYIDDEGMAGCLDVDISGDMFWGNMGDGACLARWSMSFLDDDLDADGTAGSSADMRLGLRNVVLYSAARGGRPIVLYTHPGSGGDLDSTEMGTALDQLLATGVEYTTVTEVANDWRAGSVANGFLEMRRPLRYVRLMPAPGSVLVDAGTTVSGAPTTDLLGHPVDSTPDIGAYEYQAATAED